MQYSNLSPSESSHCNVASSSDKHVEFYQVLTTPNDLNVAQGFRETLKCLTLDATKACGLAEVNPAPDHSILDVLSQRSRLLETLIIHGTIPPQHIYTSRPWPSGLRRVQLKVEYANASFLLPLSNLTQLETLDIQITSYTDPKELLCLSTSRIAFGSLQTLVFRGHFKLTATFLKVITSPKLQDVTLQGKVSGDSRYWDDCLTTLASRFASMRRMSINGASGIERLTRCVSLCDLVETISHLDKLVSIHLTLPYGAHWEEDALRTMAINCPKLEELKFWAYNLDMNILVHPQTMLDIISACPKLRVLELPKVDLEPSLLSQLQLPEAGDLESINLGYGPECEVKDVNMVAKFILRLCPKLCWVSMWETTSDESLPEEADEGWEGVVYLLMKWLDEKCDISDQDGIGHRTMNVIAITEPSQLQRLSSKQMRRRRSPTYDGVIESPACAYGKRMDPMSRVSKTVFRRPHFEHSARRRMDGQHKRAVNKALFGEYYEPVSHARPQTKRWGRTCQRKATSAKKIRKFYDSTHGVYEWEDKVKIDGDRSAESTPDGRFGVGNQSADRPSIVFFFVVWEADEIVSSGVVDMLGASRDIKTNFDELIGSYQYNDPDVDRDAQVALGLYVEENEAWDLGSRMDPISIDSDGTPGLSTTEEAWPIMLLLCHNNREISVDEEVATSIAMDEGTIEGDGAEFDITPSMHQSSMALAFPGDGTFSAGPSRFPGALDYTLSWAQGDPVPSMAQTTYGSRDSVSRTIDPGLLWTEQDHIATEYAISLDDEDAEGNEVLEEGDDDEVYDDDTSILHADSGDNDAPPVSNEDESAMFDDDVTIEAATNLPLFTPPLARPIMRSQTRASSDNNALAMPDASRGQKRRADEDGEDDDDNEKAVKRARKGKAKDTGQKKQKTKPKAKRTTKAKAKASSTKNKAEAGNTKSEEKRFPCLQADCDQTFGRQSESSRHFRCSCPKRDPDDLEKPPCPHCKEPLCRGDSVRRHIEEGACPVLKQSPGESKESGASSDGNYGKRKGGDKGGRGGGKRGRGGGKGGRGGARGGHA
ncbi:hypothetical protein POSPLADRAFT_1146452 [Postia placenta MAD-698-R-SB12]|uniref:Uncharacterized protein n=1 Tax=Postia placenta MAD-698-R-SB12 TaxID=670580 RepID=A0A1X6MX83_9APHY|nr:hypothetical protein POSPLADRAFT_1146452 [Postia placenta MAD-698-R-SB12]OSX60974.1 hypothetical protein POSPLADRAFT_1146452 [Postia placenta MAD-698-R-SB12]